LAAAVLMLKATSIRSRWGYGDTLLNPYSCFFGPRFRGLASCPVRVEAVEEGGGAKRAADGLCGAQRRDRRPHPIRRFAPPSPAALEKGSFGPGKKGGASRLYVE
jgi:hypothetical protein